MDFEIVELTGARIAFTTRSGGVSSPPYDSLNLGAFTRDDPDRIAQNIALVRDQLGLARLHWVKQVHGATIVAADDAIASGTREADGIHTDRSGAGVMVTMADCLPVVLAAPGRVLALHCGWRGLATGIIAKGIGLLGGSGVEAAIGPGISQSAYEVGPEVAAAFDGEGVDDGHLDLRAIAQLQLAAGGVKRVESIDSCTYADPARFYSYRRDGETGRQAGIAWLS